jgi:hypothetical protein
LHAAFIEPDGATSIANQSSTILNPDNGAITPPQLKLEPANEAVARDHCLVKHPVVLIYESISDADRA